MRNNFDDFHITTFLDEKYGLNLTITFDVDNFVYAPNYKKEMTEEVNFNNFSCSDLCNIRKKLNIEKTLELGTLLLDLLNNAEKICKEFKNYKENIIFAPFIIEKSTKYWENSNLNTDRKYGNYFNNLYGFILQLNKNSSYSSIVPFLLNEFYNFYYIYFSNIETALSNYNLKNISHSEIEVQKEKITQLIKKNKSKYNILDESITNKNMLSQDFYKNKIEQFIDNIISEITEIQSSSENLFIKSKVAINEFDYEEITKFNRETLNLPQVTVNITNAKKHAIVKYNYNVHTLKELNDITIYHLLTNRQQLIRCAYCHDFFIKKSNKERYCNKIWGKKKNGENITCKQKGKDRTYKSKRDDIKEEYNRIHCKIYNASKRKKLKEDEKEIIRAILKKLQLDYNNIEYNTINYEEKVRKNI